MSMTIGGKGAKADINMTPMIDVLLVLIIIFMVITPLASHGLHALVPQPATTTPDPAPPDRDIVITARDDGTALLNQESLTLAELQSRLLDLFKQAARNVVFVRGEKDLPFARVAEVIEMAHTAGVDRIALMTN